MRRSVAIALASALGIGLAAVAAQPAIPELTGRVVDLADVLAPHVEDGLATRLAGFEDATTAQVVVLTIPSLNGEVLEEYATTVFRTWGLGQAESDNGVLLLIARDDRELRIEVGYGLEGELTDAAAGRIIRNVIVPRFKRGGFDAGVLEGVEAILGTLEGTYEPPSSSGATLNGQPLHAASLEDRLWFGILFSSLPLILLLLMLLRARPASPGEVTGAGCLGTFCSLFVGIGVWVVFVSFRAGLITFVAIPLLLMVLTRWPVLNPLAWLTRWAEQHPTWGPKLRHARLKREAFAEARKRGEKRVVVDGVTYRVPARTSSSGGSSGWSSSSSSSFSGGGGSSGGGGASGGW